MVNALRYTRRQAIATLTATSAAAALTATGRGVHAAGSDVVRIGLVGCGNRGSGACRDALSTKAAVRLTAVGDLFADRIEASLKNLTKYDELRVKIDVPPARRFVGFDAYRQVIAAEVDLVLLATPPHFRPMHYAAAVEAGKHAFLEKPCCIDAPGYRTLVAANAVAQAKKLSVGIGMQRRHQRNYLEGIRRIHEGELGRVLLVRTYFNMAEGGRAGRVKPAGMSEMEYQLRHWGVFSWLCGDHLVEQAAHEIDIANWVLGSHPIEANGLGGRQVRFGPGNGDIFDHHAIEFVHPGGVRHFCQARQQAGTWVHVSDNVHGERGTVTLGTGAWGLGKANPRTMRTKAAGVDNPYQKEHDDLLASITGAGPHLFEGTHGAASSMTAVLGRMATYSGQVVRWDDAVQSNLRLGPAEYSFDAAPPARPDDQGTYAAAIPGVTKAW